MRHSVLSAIALVAALAGPAHALKPGDHASITYDACVATGLPRDFCTRTATEDYNTDSREWDTLAAHAQIDRDQTACAGADAATARVFHLGRDLRAALAAVHTSGGESNVSAAASALGRALHTIQDNCAHRGMPNPQHAWFSISDFCDGTTSSPDVQDDALACARTETAAAMAAAAQTIRASGSDVESWLAAASCPMSASSESNNSGAPEVCRNRVLPGPVDACSFLSEAKNWDGIDRTWANPVMVAALRGAFRAGTTDAPEPSAVCGGDETVLSAAVSAPLLDVTTGPTSCIRAKVFCLGKADGDDNPFADDAAPVATDGGCSTGGGGNASMLALLLVGLALAARRR